MRLVTVLAAITLVLTAACGGNDDTESANPTPIRTTTAAATTTTVTAAETTPAPTEFRVALINLMSPVTVDATDRVASDTYDQRLAMVIEELKAFKPDLVAVNEATNTRDHGSAVAVLAKELKMESAYVRANPWYPGIAKDQNDEIAKQSGFEELDAILTRDAFPILKYDRQWLNPRTSETEGRGALHVIVKVPANGANIDVYLTHLTGGGERVRAAQVASLLSFIKDTRGRGPLLLLGDLSDGPGSLTYKAVIDSGLHDLGVDDNLATCCREKIVGEQPALTQRTDYIFAERWTAPAAALWADKPRKRADGALLYPSDHNGLQVVIPFATPPP